MVEAALVVWTALFCLFLSWMKIDFAELMAREAAEEAVVMAVVMTMLKRVGRR